LAQNSFWHFCVRRVLLNYLIFGLNIKSIQKWN
jgi:hypothetical protein